MAGCARRTAAARGPRLADGVDRIARAAPGEEAEGNSAQGQAGGREQSSWRSAPPENRIGPSLVQERQGAPIQELPVGIASSQAEDETASGAPAPAGTGREWK